MSRAKTPEPRPGELPEEFQLRRLVARHRLKTAKAMLATYASAGVGRRNKDWKASNASADLAIIPDTITLNARARQCVRDSWIGKSAVRAFSRNVVGCGILPIPMAKDANGKLLPKLNKKLLKLFWHWANNREFCDVEKRQTFWQKQNLIVEERVTVGEAFLIWSYQPNEHAVGLRVQSFESEQLDLRLLSFFDPVTQKSNQVRGGVEVDENGAPVAYHFYTRNPVDYLISSYRSIRILANRVIHYFKQERVLQTRGVTPLAPVLQEVRDFSRYRDATLWRAIMEACIGMVIKKDGVGGPSPFGVAAAPGDPGQTNSGMRTIDFVPGMVPELNPGESVDPYIPSSPGNQYEPYIKTGLRGIGAGIGLSGSQLTRQSESNYSAARQDMLEDRKEFEPEQEMMAHNVLLNPLWPIFVRLAVLEGRLDDVLDPSEFSADAESVQRFCEAEYVAPAAPWIDPQNEATAYEKLIALKVMNRSEVAALRGRRLDDIWDEIEVEQEKAKKLNITLPENKDDLAFKRETLAGFIKDGTVCDVVANATQITELVDETGLPANTEYKDPYLPVKDQAGNLVTGEVIKDKAGDIVGGDVEDPAPPPASPPPPGLIPGQNGNGKGPNGSKNGKTPGVVAASGDPALPEVDLAAKREQIARRLTPYQGPPKEPPDYRDGDETLNCGTCSFFDAGTCTKFNAQVEPAKVCDVWESHPVGKDDESGTKKILAPFRPPDQPYQDSTDTTPGPFTENPAYGN